MLHNLKKNMGWFRKCAIFHLYLDCLNIALTDGSEQIAPASLSNEPRIAHVKMAATFAGILQKKKISVFSYPVFAQQRLESLGHAM